MNLPEQEFLEQLSIFELRYCSQYQFYNNLSMKFIVLFVILVYITFTQQPNQFPDFQAYVSTFSKGYNPTSPEWASRKAIYLNNIEKMKHITDYIPGVNNMTDWSDQEISALQTLQTMPEVSNTQNSQLLRAHRLGAPQNLDWRDRNAITSIKNQGDCGCCWAFASAAYAQSKMIIAGRYTSQNINLSEQYLLECTPYGNCNGGYLQYAFETIQNIPTEEKYPYQPFKKHPGICETPQGEKILTGSKGFVGYNLTDDDLINLLQNGPVAIAISSKDWTLYRAGIFKCTPGSKVDHAVLLVGYSPDYWIVKNQWGENWGSNGYILVSRTKINNCNIGFSAFTLSEGWWRLRFMMVILAAFLLLIN